MAAAAWALMPAKVDEELGDALQAETPEEPLKMEAAVHLYLMQRESPPGRSRTSKSRNQKLRSNQALVHQHRTGLKKSGRFPISQRILIPPIGSRGLRLMEKKLRLNRRPRLLIGSKAWPKREPMVTRVAARPQPIGSGKLATPEVSLRNKLLKTMIPRVRKSRLKLMKGVERRIGSQRFNPLLTMS